MTLPSDVLQSFVEMKSALPKGSPWPITTLSLCRNLSVAKFLPSLSKESKIELLELISSRFQEAEEEFFILPLKEMPLWQKEFLLEHFAFPYDLFGNHEAEALITNRSGDLLIVVNFQDHLILHAIDFYADPEKTLEKLVKLDIFLHDKLSFAFSSEFGFLTVDPQRCGTALQGRCFLHVPALMYSKELPTLLEPSTEISSSGLLPSSPADFSGNVVVLTNTCSLGLTEEQILSSLRIWASKLLVAEAAAKKRFSDENNGELKNHILRALGLLTHSCHLELQETLDALSWLQLGIELNWIKNPKNHAIEKQVLWEARRGHLALQEPENSRDLQKEHVMHLRAHKLKTLAEDFFPEEF
ncbi:protein arginine kinase [Chlamydia pecorum]|uniref:protein arginine kinase n=1 Tax=Chlamydia pecorum TaxID=85991 RepID=UPI0003AE06B0|nr:protein arginine kinase [Chlamydia pecorum]AGW39400.1 putative ATP:guanido phosphotransferase [Chlamydia pecorum P787]